MSKELTTISPEGLEIANSYIVLGNIKGVCQDLGVTQDVVVDWLNKREVKKYIDTVYYDLGYRNRNNIASLLDTMIESKLEEAQVSEQYTSKDLADLMMMAHKFRMDELKMAIEADKVAGTSIRQQTNVQINDAGNGMFGQTNYGTLLEKLVNGEVKE
jgi:hypothetical protein